jgi:2-polyprenyl-3-methyl-5-hydroxy-6-metoxy-1,4-benzoquinol methylase
VSKPSQKPVSAGTRVREHFRAKAFSFDRLYDEDHALQRLLRPALARRRDIALHVVREHGGSRVLDVGCGSGRIGELVLESGAREYVGIDFAEPMLDLARRRLERFGERAQLVAGDFEEVDLEGPFEVVLALGLFDYIPKPEPLARRMAALCSGSLVASFPTWTWLKGPIRKLRYEVLSDCPIYDYAEPDLRELFRSVGFAAVTVERMGRSGLVIRADR